MYWIIHVVECSLPKLQQKKGVTLSSEETIRMFSCLADAPEKYRTAITVLVYTGLRKGELCGLKWTDIDFAKGILNVNGGLEYLPFYWSVSGGCKDGNGKDLSNCQKQPYLF